MVKKRVSKEMNKVTGMLPSFSSSRSINTLSFTSKEVGDGVEDEGAHEVEDEGVVETPEPAIAFAYKSRCRSSFFLRSQRRSLPSIRVHRGVSSSKHRK
jgi:hypothetical protein